MIVVNYSKPTRLDELKFDVRLDRTKRSLPNDIQGRVDAKFTQFADETEAKSGKRPTKGEICTLSQYKILSDGLEGVCKIATFDEVLYFARSEIDETDYDYGRENVGYPIASWGVLISRDNNLLFLRKKGAEGAYEGSPYSALGALISADKDVEDERLSPVKLLDRGIGGEIGNAVWERTNTINYLGLNVYDENSKKVNNGYDTVWTAQIDANMSEIMGLLEENPQFEKKSKAESVMANPNELRDFIVKKKTTASGLAGILNFIGSHFGPYELKKQYESYREQKGKEAVEISFINY